jgi:glyoxylase-like metal-dependent hydrolase (beta-lactamase superfamily II)
METLVAGDVKIMQFTQWEGPFLPGGEMFPDSKPGVFEANAHWLAPSFWDPQSGIIQMCSQMFVLRSEGRNILIDTGIGNDKERPGVPMFSHLQTGFPSALGTAGLGVEDIDVVVLTHLHIEHVGGNTQLVNGEWVPAFPHATYLVPGIDYEYWNPAGTHKPKGAALNQNVFEDSIQPLGSAGQMVLWEGSYRIDANLTLEPAPGHTPGSSVLKLRSAGEQAVFVGDVIHSPVQIVEPEWSSCLCEDERVANETRQRVLAWAADEHVLVIPTHLPGPRGAEIERAGTKFRIKRWAPFEPPGADAGQAPNR